LLPLSGLETYASRPNTYISGLKAYVPWKKAYAFFLLVIAKSSDYMRFSLKLAKREGLSSQTFVKEAGMFYSLPFISIFLSTITKHNFLLMSCRILARHLSLIKSF